MYIAQTSVKVCNKNRRFFITPRPSISKKSRPHIRKKPNDYPENKNWICLDKIFLRKGQNLKGNFRSLNSKY